jgi:hypothetical protein
MPVSIGSVSSRPAATATCATASASSLAATDRQLWVVLDRHRRKAEPAVAAVDRGAGAVDDEVDRLRGERAGDVGEQPARDEHAARIADRGVEFDASGRLVVEPGDREAVAVGPSRGLDEDAAEHRDRRPRREAAGHPGCGVGEDVAFDPELHEGTSRTGDDSGSPAGECRRALWVRRPDAAAVPGGPGPGRPP